MKTGTQLWLIGIGLLLLASLTSKTFREMIWLIFIFSTIGAVFRIIFWLLKSFFNLATGRGMLAKREKMFIDLRNAAVESNVEQTKYAFNDAVATLVRLGYTLSQARTAVAQATVNVDPNDRQALIREALRIMNP